MQLIEAFYRTRWFQVKAGTAHLSERRKMMQQWADYLDKLKVGAEVISLRSEAG